MTTMRIVQKGYGVALWRAGLMALVVLVALPQFALAQSPTTTTPTPAQLEAFRNLPPSQQQSVLDAVGGRQQGGQQDAQLATPQTSILLQRPPVADGPPRMGPRSTLLIAVTLREANPDEIGDAVLTDRRDRVLKANPYQLDAEGRITLPIAPPVNLSGLTDAEAAQLLDADPRLAGLNFSVTLLPVKSEGVQGLEQFGYDVFDEVPTTFAPATDIPVPVDYRVGPGDNITVDLFGKKTGHYLLVVDRNGALTVPEFGPIQVTGLSFDEVRSEIEQRVGAQMIGVRASVTMGQLRSIRIFVVGDVARAGSYTVSGLSTITNALFASGGVSKVGSLRNIQLKRGGQSVARFDLYDLLLKGDTSQDLQLDQGDAIFVPAIGSTAGVSGQVRRPAIYEFRNGTTVAELIELSGGLKPEADPRLVRLERINGNRDRVVLGLDLTRPGDRAQKLLSGDLLTVAQVLDDAQGVSLEGHVERTGAHAWWQGMRLTDLLGSLNAFKLNADQRYVLIRREHSHDRRIEVLSADATRAFQARGTAADPLLQSRDRIIVFGRQADRGTPLAELLQEMSLQTRDNSPMPAVWIQGRVRAAGKYPLEQNMTVSDLIRAGGGLEDAAYAAKAELTRYEVVNGESRKTEVIDLALVGTATAAAMPLRAYDVLVVKETPDWREQESIILRGEVRFPGNYPIRYRETLSSVIKRAGGLTEAAFPAGSVFMREEIKEQERKQLEVLTNRLQSDLALAAVRNTQDFKEGGAETLSAGQSLLAQLKDVKPIGRLVIDIKQALARDDSSDNIELRGGDQLVVPRIRPYVTVIGEVQNTASHVWKEGLSRDDYVDLSGGTTPRADNKRIYVVHANGSVVTTANDNRWFGGGNSDLEPGDFVVIPIDTEPSRALAVWTAATTIVYNIAVAVAAIGSL